MAHVEIVDVFGVGDGLNESVVLLVRGDRFGGRLFQRERGDPFVQHAHRLHMPFRRLFRG